MFRSNSFSHATRPYNINNLLHRSATPSAHIGLHALSDCNTHPPQLHTSLDSIEENARSQTMPELEAAQAVLNSSLSLAVGSSGIATPALTTLSLASPFSSTPNLSIPSLTSTIVTSSSSSSSVPNLTSSPSTPSLSTARLPAPQSTPPSSMLPPQLYHHNAYQLPQSSPFPGISASHPHANSFPPAGFPHSLGPSPLGLAHQQKLHQMRMQDLYFMAFNKDGVAGFSGAEKCAVCSDTSSGFHYSVLSCEGCKGFFRRSVQKGTEYVCHKEGRCKVDRVTRNRCQACRFNKCISVGMTKESVRQDKNKKRRTKEEERDAELSATRNALKVVEQVHEEYKKAFPSENQVMESVEDLRSRVTQFAHGIPGFGQTPAIEFTQMVNKSLRGILLLRLAYFNNAGDRNLLCDANLDELLEKLRRTVEDIKPEEVALLSAMHIVGCDTTLSDSLSTGMEAFIRLNFGRTSSGEAKLESNSNEEGQDEQASSSSVTQQQATSTRCCRLVMKLRLLC